VSENTDQAMTDPQDSADVYFNEKRIFSISSIASILSWFFLVFAILFLIPFLVQLFSIPEFSFDLLLSILSDVVLNFSLAFVLLFLFVLLRAISEGLLVLLEIEENTRKD
jgi:magnesium-transporting ATPase (P-type)